MVGNNMINKEIEEEKEIYFEKEDGQIQKDLKDFQQKYNQPWSTDTLTIVRHGEYIEQHASSSKTTVDSFSEMYSLHTNPRSTIIHKTEQKTGDKIGECSIYSNEAMIIPQPSKIGFVSEEEEQKTSQISDVDYTVSKFRDMQYLKKPHIITMSSTISSGTSEQISLSNSSAITPTPPPSSISEKHANFNKNAIAFQSPAMLSNIHTKKHGSVWSELGNTPLHQPNSNANILYFSSQPRIPRLTDSSFMDSTITDDNSITFTESKTFTQEMQASQIAGHYGMTVKSYENLPTVHAHKPVIKSYIPQNLNLKLNSSALSGLLNNNDTCTGNISSNLNVKEREKVKKNKVGKGKIVEMEKIVSSEI